MNAAARVTREWVAAKLLITSEHKRQMSGNKSCGYIMMDPHAFLDLTVSGSLERKGIMNDAADIEVYNSAARQGKSIIPPFLTVDRVKRKIVGHEGRHRAAACIKEGTLVMPVFLILRTEVGNTWRLPVYPGDRDRAFEKRLVKASDFPDRVIGEFSTYQATLPLKTWVALDV